MLKHFVFLTFDETTTIFKVSAGEIIILEGRKKKKKLLISRDAFENNYNCKAIYEYGLDAIYYKWLQTRTIAYVNPWPCHLIAR